MDFKIGDFVKGNGRHINAGRRMSDVGVVLREVRGMGFMVAWFSDMSVQFAYDDELEIARRDTEMMK